MLVAATGAGAEEAEPELKAERAGQHGTELGRPLTRQDAADYFCQSTSVAASWDPVMPDTLRQNVLERPCGRAANHEKLLQRSLSWQISRPYSKRGLSITNTAVAASMATPALDVSAPPVTLLCSPQPILSVSQRRLPSTETKPVDSANVLLSAKPLNSCQGSPLQN